MTPWWMSKCIRSSSTGFCTSPEDNQWGNKRGVCVFISNCDHYQSKKAKLDIKDYTASALDSIKNNDLSNNIESLQIDDGVIVDVYDGGNFNGETIRYKGPADITMGVFSDDPIAREWNRVGTRLSSIRISKDCDNDIFMWDDNCNAHCNNTSTICYNKRLSQCNNSDLANNSTCYNLCNANRSKCSTVINNLCSNWAYREHGMCDSYNYVTSGHCNNWDRRNDPKCAHVKSDIIKNICVSDKFNDSDCVTYCNANPVACGTNTGSYNKACSDNINDYSNCSYFTKNNLTLDHPKTLDR